MLAIRLQRLGRKSLPMYRLAVQESRRHPSSGIHNFPLKNGPVILTIP